MLRESWLVVGGLAAIGKDQEMIPPRDPATRETWVQSLGREDHLARDGGAWWAAVYGITQSRTRLK